MSSPEPPAEAASQEPIMQEIIPKPPPQAPWLANCDALKNPPPSYRRIQNNRVTPAYILAWTCSRQEFYANISDDRWQANSNLERTIVWRRLIAACGEKRKRFVLPFQIEVGYGYDGEVYLGIMFNFSIEKHYDELKDMWRKDEFLYVRDAYGIPKNKALDETLAWYRYPAQMNRDYKAIRWRAT